jgi:hypothetical protein
MSNNEILTRLRTEIERTDSKTERQCGEILKEIAWVLLSAHTSCTFVASEQFVSAGRVDIVVIADAMQPGGTLKKEGHVWELKAPQIQLFEMKTKSQAQPSKELFCAETQLMHYCNAISKDEGLRNRWEIISSDDIKLGGVIIGRDRNFIKTKRDDEILGKQLGHEALDIRTNYLYKHISFNLWTWDNFLAIAKNQMSSHQYILGDPNTSIDLSRMSKLSST